MNRLVIIGNGFDLAHGLKTSYKHFIEWYWEQRIESFIDNRTKISEDCLCSITIEDATQIGCWSYFARDYVYRRDIHNNRVNSNDQIVEWLRTNPNVFSYNSSPFFSRITQSIETKGWVDIENEYYSLLKKNKDNPEECKTLNTQLEYLQNKLVEYLSSLKKVKSLQDIEWVMLETIHLEDIARNSRAKVFEEIDSSEDEYRHLDNASDIEQKWSPQRIMMLSFNYTETIGNYKRIQNVRFEAKNGIECNYIHGDLAHPQNVIFGYGDELDKDFQSILDANDNELLKHSKNNLYLETNHYRKMLEFIESAPFQVYIMGHSCGLSDRTLLNTIFEHDNCVSIKPYYYKRPDGTDNYLELVQNISRSFKDMKLYRARVVNKEQCEPLPQI